MSPEERRVGFLARGADDGYLRRLGRLRWERRLPGAPATLLEEAAAAVDTFQPGETWTLVRNETALPLPGADPFPGAGEVLVASVPAPGATPPVHTLRELEEAGAVSVTASPAAAPALSWRVSDFPPRPEEPVGGYVARLLSNGAARSIGAEFAGVAFEQRPRDERADVTRHFPSGIRRLLDVGCGAGDVSAALARRCAGLHVTGIEKNAGLAALARAQLPSVLESDASGAIAALARAGERFDALLFADVLEHLDDPIAALRDAREIAEPAATLVATVPNVGHLSLVRDLVLGRFDPLPAGLADAGHLRWFTRTSLEEALEEAGWRPLSIGSLPGGPAPGALEFLEWASGWPDADRDSLSTYQWIAVATA